MTSVNFPDYGFVVFTATSSFYRIGEFAQRIGHSARTVRRWEAEGRVRARRAPKGSATSTTPMSGGVLQSGFDESCRRTVVHCRVSSPGQKNDLVLQIAAMEQLCLARGKDLLGIVHTFSGRLSGLRGYGTTLRDELTGGLW